ncbi:hypothetical protein ADEAN_000245500 [Angomonas deanei]|uniref:Uncharacterized protein n=1 Tax=Angomonas deanei TaxID=59799 RepID=A0A7G2CAG4_9TRYP|nr:hypothetical protein ADEAN_000245500 [Angomonas deanei]
MLKRKSEDISFADAKRFRGDETWQDRISLTPRSVECSLSQQESYPNPFFAPLKTSRSPSMNTVSTEVMSEDSSFCTDAANCAIVRRPRRKANVQEDNDAQRWQNELNAFFSRLDDRPLYVTKP